MSMYDSVIGNRASGEIRANPCNQDTLVRETVPQSLVPLISYGPKKACRDPPRTPRKLVQQAGTQTVVASTVAAIREGMAMQGVAWEML
jgi:hypothetical protein